MLQQTKMGVLYAIAAYGLWGILPIYFKQVQFLSSFEIFVHRIVWSVVFTGLLILLFGNAQKIYLTLRNKRNVFFLLMTSILIACNWLLFIWAVNNGFMLETSLGYYINPLFNIVLGVLFLGEKLRRNQYIAVAMMVCAVLFEVVNYGAFPWIAISLAVSFGCYGLLRKKIEVDSQTGLLIETSILMLPALIYWIWMLQSEYSNLFENSWQTNSLILLAGPFTSIPLMLFASAAQRLNYGTLGFFQYIAPSIVLLLAVFVYDEALPFHKAITFLVIWLALAVLSIDSLHQQRQAKLSARV